VDGWGGRGGQCVAAGVPGLCWALDATSAPGVLWTFSMCTSVGQEVIQMEKKERIGVFISMLGDWLQKGEGKGEKIK